MRKWNADADKRNSRSCGHAFCGDCRTKRGRNRGNRSIRHAVRNALRGLR